MPTDVTDQPTRIMHHWLVAIVSVHLGLFALFSVLAVAVADSFIVPEIMLSYGFPYGFARRGLGPDAIPFVFFLQVAVVLSAAASVFLHRGAKTWSKALAIALAVLWFLAVILINLAAYVH